MADWPALLKAANKTCIIQDEKRKIHYTFQDGSEMVEEYHLKTYELSVRKHKMKTMTGSVTKWEFEIGQDIQPINIDAHGIAESLSNPICVRKDSKEAFEWRIRNLPYPLETYNVQVDPEENCIVIRTTNKKYYKKFQIPDLTRMKLQLAQSNLTIAHANNTLILKYRKPIEILELEKSIREELQKMKKGEGDIEMCSPS